MSRPKKCRKVCMEPSYDSFIPGGIPLKRYVQLTVDEAVETLIKGNLQFNPDVHCDHHEPEE